MELKLGQKRLGQHGSNIYYKEFFVTTEKETKCYRPGRFYFVQKSEKYPVSIAEFQLIWHNLKDEKNYASVKLYLKPEIQFEQNEYETFGKDEVLEANRQVVIECCQFPSWECTSNKWHNDVGETLYNGIEFDKLKSMSREKDSIIKKDATSQKKVKILSFPQYCRYKTCLKMLKLGVSMTYLELIARGGLDIKNLNTLILFSKKQTEKDEIEEFSPTQNVQVPVFKGRPRKRKNIDNTSCLPKKKARIENDERIEWKKEKYKVVIETHHKENGNTPEMKAEQAKGIRGRDTVSQQKRESTIKNKEEHERFSKEVHDFMADQGMPILKIPRIGCAPVDPLVMYRAVTDRGGYAEVTVNKRWRDVYDCLGHSTMITNAATATRKIYERLLLPYENYSKHDHPIQKINRTNDSNATTRRNSVEKIYPREKVLNKRDTISIPEVIPISDDKKNENESESLSISLMMSKQRGRPSNKFRNQIEKLRNKQTQKLAEEMKNVGNSSQSTVTNNSQSTVTNNNNRQYKHYPRKQTWVNELNVDIVNSSSRKKDREETSSDIELISPRRIEVHSPFRQGRRLYSSSKDHSSIPNGIVQDTFVPILPRTAKPAPAFSRTNDFCEFKIQSVRSLATADEPKAHAPPASSKPNTLQYLHYPYSTAGYQYMPSNRQYYSLNETNKLVPVAVSDNQNHNKGTFRDSTFAMRTFRNENQTTDNNSYKIKSSALKNHEPYIIHHPSHVNRTYREIPGQYPVIYTHHPTASRYQTKNDRSNYRLEPSSSPRPTRYISATPIQMREYNNPATEYIYERLPPRYEKIVPRVEKISPRTDKISPGESARTGNVGYVQYVENSASKRKWSGDVAVVSVSCHM